MTNSKFTIIEVASNFTDAVGVSQLTRLMCVQSGKVFAVVTAYDTNGVDCTSQFVWCWPRVNGLSHTWLYGDSICGKDGKPWKRTASALVRDANGVPQAHHDAVKHITSLAEAGYVDWDKAAYSGKPIPNLFHDPVVTPPVSRSTRQQYTSTAPQHPNDTFESAMNEVSRLAKEMGITTVMPTAADIKAMQTNTYLQSHNYGVKA